MKSVVIGAGVIGLSCAFELSQLGHEVTVLDGDELGAGASAGNAGWVTPFLSTPRAAPGAARDAVLSLLKPASAARVHLRLEPGFALWGLRFLCASAADRSARATESLQRFARGVQDSFDSLQARGVQFEQYRDGLAVVFKQQANLDHYEGIVANVRRLGYDGVATTHRGCDVRAFDPAIADGLAGVIHLESERHVRPETLTRGLRDAVLAAGGRIIETDSVVQMSRRGHEWLVACASGTVHVGDHVVVASGLGSKALLAPLGVHLPLEAAKGTSMTAQGTGTVPTHPLKMYEDMVACSPFGTALRLSATFDIGARDFDIDRKRLDMVVRQGLTYLWDWRPQRVEMRWSGHRPTTIDDTPIIGPVPAHDGLYIATGHGTLGVTLGPLTGALAAKEIALREPQPLLEPFRITRF